MRARQEGWTSDEPFTADGTLIESWASLKSFGRKAGADQRKIQAAKDEDPGPPSVNFRGEKRCNDTHQSTTDPDSVLYRKAQGKEARLCFGGHILMENSNGLCAEITLHDPIRAAEPAVAVEQMDEHEKLHAGVTVKTLGADKGYHRKEFIAACRERETAPHGACNEGVKFVGLDARTPGRSGYQTSQRIAQAGGRNLWLYEDRGRPETPPVSRPGTDPGVGLLYRWHLQSAVAGAAGGSGVKANRKPRQKPGANEFWNTPARHAPGVGPGEDIGDCRSYTGF